MSRLKKSKIIQEVGEERFQAAREQIRRIESAYDSSFRDGRKTIDAIVDHLWQSQAPSYRTFHLLLSFFEDLPTYHFMMEAKTGFQDRSDREKRAFWKWARSILENGDAAQREALGYALWCEFFEDPQTVDEAWQNLIEPLPNDQALHTILIHSGPVPWEKKWSLFLGLQRRAEMHYYIFRSVLHSQFDIYGRLDQREALQILERLQIPPETKHLSKLRDKLQKSLARG